MDEDCVVLELVVVIVPVEEVLDVVVVVVVAELEVVVLLVVDLVVVQVVLGLVVVVEAATWRLTGAECERAASTGHSDGECTCRLTRRRHRHCGIVGISVAVVSGRGVGAKREFLANEMLTSADGGETEYVRATGPLNPLVGMRSLCSSCCSRS
ncbi:MAG TPA: hypothetical protein VK127_03620 [Nitrososphaerales archaeon]|nr:hypothetical protein [Nitrososphaerales archaeon]